jgi:FAD/FMN-containing dehydrogenase/Fe-S oxidoreductase
MTTSDAASDVSEQRLLGELTQRLERELEGEVQSDDYSRHLYSRDASMYSIKPLCVVFPKHADDVAATVKTAAAHGVTVTPRGAGTSLAGQTIGPGIVLDCSRHMTSILELDPGRRIARVQVGVVQDDLNRAAAPFGLMFGPDTSTSNRATIGGMLGNNSAGSGSVQYGMTIDHVRAVDVVLADGSIAHFAPVEDLERHRRASMPTLEGSLYRELPAIVANHAEAIATGFPPFWRRACGYRLERIADPSMPFDLASFIVGSEGTLAIATTTEVGLVPKPKHTVYAVGHFHTIPEAIEATTDALSCQPAQVELMDKTILDLSRQKIEYAALSASLVGDPGALLFVSFTGDDLDDVLTRLDRLIDLWRRNGHGYQTLRLVTAEQQSELLKVRKSSLGLLMAAGEGSNRPLAFVEDTAVPPGVLAEYTARFAQILDEYDMTAGFYGHCSVGCLHIRPFIDLSRPDEIERMRVVAERIKDLVKEFGGVNSSEHGDGLARSEFNRDIFGDELYEAMRDVKRLFDPDQRLNPGKIVDAPSMTDNLRDANLPPAPLLRTRLDFEAVGGMRGAADRCMNIGLCRKSTTGTMCPSYIATREEEHATRGRANALVKALSEPDPKAALGSERLHDILDLCLMCKACKAECPLGVDMGKLKSETLSHYHDMHGVPLRSRIFGSIRAVNRLGSALGPLANLPGRNQLVRRLMAQSIGIAPRRPMPQYKFRNLMRWYARHGRRGQPDASIGTVTFLADSLTSFTEPHVGRAAIDLLKRAGWSVELVGNGCCGRAALSKGLVDKATANAKAMIAQLHENTVAGSPIVGCEPSCLFTLRDEHVSMIRNDPRVRAVAARVRQVEELLAESIDDGRLALAADSWLAGRKILYHGHCHQKAEVGTAASVALLRRIPGAEVIEIDAGCCGMAGSFGYEVEHYDISMKVGSDRLFPAIEAAGRTTIVAATGTSCREQIFHGTARSAWHPVELIAQALVSAPSRETRDADNPLH